MLRFLFGACWIRVRLQSFTLVVTCVKNPLTETDLSFGAGPLSSTTGGLSQASSASSLSSTTRVVSSRKWDKSTTDLILDESREQKRCKVYIFFFWAFTVQRCKLFCTTITTSTSSIKKQELWKLIECNSKNSHVGIIPILVHVFHPVFSIFTASFAVNVFKSCCCCCSSSSSCSCCDLLEVHIFAHRWR